MIQPQFEILPTDLDDDLSRLLEVGRITPVYESLSGTSKLSSRWIRRVIHGVLEELKGSVPGDAARCHRRTPAISQPRRGPARRSLS